MPFYRDRISSDGFDRNCIGRRRIFCLWPRRCWLSGRWLWMRWVYQRTAMWTGPGDPVFEHRWYDPSEFLLYELKGTL